MLEKPIESQQCGSVLEEGDKHMKTRKLGMRIVGGADPGKGRCDGGKGDCVVESIKIHDEVPGLQKGKGVSLFDVCGLLQNDLGLTVTMQEVIQHLEEAGVEGVKVTTDYAGITSLFNFSGWSETWKSSFEPFMDPSGIGVLEKVPKYAGLKKHPAWKELKNKAAQEKWRVVE
jgi:hypothetical protein